MKNENVKHENIKHENMKRPSEITDVRQRKKSKLDISSIGTDLSVLGQFVQIINDGDPDDMMATVLASEDILSILSFLDSGSRRKASELTIVLQALYALIISGITGDTDLKQTSVVRQLAEGVLEDTRLIACSNGLRNNQGAETNKAALRLLASIVAFDVNLARGLLRTFSFKNNDIVQCSRRRNTHDEQDVRSCFLNLVGAFVFQDSSLLLRELVLKKDIFSSVINESYIDKYANIMLILKMLQKIADNRTVSKSLKFQLFNRSTLKHLLYLYVWKGEALTFQELSNKNLLDVDDAQLQSIRMALHNLLSLLFTSSRVGLVFSQSSSESKIASNDHILFALTSPPMESAHSDSLRFDLVVSSLTTCPDIVQSYLDHMAPLMQPRASSKNWFTLMDLIYKIFDASRVHLVEWATGALDRSSNLWKAAELIVQQTTLSPKMSSPMTNALHFEESQDVVVEAKRLMKLILTNVAILLTWIDTGDLFRTNKKLGTELKAHLNQLFSERMPTAKWSKRLQVLFEESFKDNASLLADQITTTKPGEEPPASENGKSDDSGMMKPISHDPAVEQAELNALPKNLRKSLKLFQQYDSKPSDVTECSDKLTEALNSLSSIMEQCFATHFHVPVVHRCLAAGLRLMKLHSPGTKLRVKRLLRNLIKCNQFRSMLLVESISGSSLTAEAAEKTNSVDEASPVEENAMVLKDGVLELLLELVQIKVKPFLQLFPILWLLPSYTATLNPIDQKLFKIIYAMDMKSKRSLLTCCEIGSNSPTPLVWGSIVHEHYQFQNEKDALLETPIIFRQPNPMTLFNMLDEKRLSDSAIHFPMNHKWLGKQQQLKQTKEVPQPTSFVSTRIDYSQLYDPCFLLHVFRHYLSLYKSCCDDTVTTSKSIVDQFLRNFHAHHCIDYAVASLSSYSKHIRTTARAVIADYHSLASAWTPSKSKGPIPEGKLSLQVFPERPQICFILDSLRNSLAAGGGSTLGGKSRRGWMFASPADTVGRLTRVHGNFFVRCLQLLLKPEHHMYQAMWNCFLSKPALNLNEVPDFLRLFFSTDKEFRAERLWITRLCAESVEDTADYLVLERTHAFKHMLSAYSAPSSEVSFQLFILQLLVSVTQHSRLTHVLIRFHALPLWLWRHALSPSSLLHQRRFRMIVDNMLKTLGPQETNSNPATVVLHQLDAELRKVPENVSNKSDALNVN